MSVFRKAILAATCVGSLVAMEAPALAQTTLRAVMHSDLKILDPISMKYTGKPFPYRNPQGRVALYIELDKARYEKLPFEHTPAA